MISTVLQIDTLRSLVYTSISGSYAAVGTAVDHPIKMIVITNNTNGDMFISDDGDNDKMFLPKTFSRVLDISTNRQGNSPELALSQGTQFYVRESSSPSSGSIYIEIYYAKGT